MTSTPSATPPGPRGAGSPTPPPLTLRDPLAWATWQALLTAEPEVHDPVAVYQRLTGRAVAWATPTPHPPLSPGTVQTFYVTDTDGVRAFPLQARLAYATPHAYIWVDTRVSFSNTTVEQLGQEFETHIYPTTRAFFGPEPSPGIDGDPHLYILFAQGVGSVAGYFSSADALPPQVHEFSNAHEMFILSAQLLSSRNTTYAVLAHEFQHMIHQNRDPNEATWLNEGFSELAVLLNGYDHGFFDALYLAQPDLPLLHWPDPSQGSTLPYYGGGFLFTLYFLEHFGEQATQALVAEPANGVAGVQAVLQRLGARHPVTGAPLRAEELFLDWAIANFLNDPELADGRFGYMRRRILPAQPTVRVTECPTQDLEGELAPFGVDYITITCRGTWHLEVQLEPWARLWPTDPHGGDFAVWSTYGDESDMHLTRAFDFTALAPGQPLTLHYWTWFDIEDNYDYGYVLISTDGQKWTMLRPPAATDEDPVGNNYGWGYTRRSPGWIHEQVDLSPYAGQRVWLRFEYLTDAAVNHWGWLVDDITIPEIGYAEGFEHGLGGWEATGWARAANRIPRGYQAALVLQGRGQTQVHYLPMGDDLRVRADLPLDAEWQSATLVLMDTTRYARLPAAYRVDIRTP
ncbi:MAG: hypothetical protein GXO37_04545 [Chloroflexi bacterium]|nr:hypothetical protein [Chloroflexota bacterium]